MLHHSDDSPSWVVSWVGLRLLTVTLDLHLMVNFGPGRQVSSFINRVVCSNDLFVAIAGHIVTLNSWYVKLGSSVHYED